MPSYLLSSHDGFGLGHVRRNSLIAQAIVAAEPAAEVTIVTGLPFRPGWLRLAGVRIVRVPPLVKDSVRGYRAVGTTFEAAVARRADVFAETVARHQPDVVVVDRHPYGTAGELRRGLVAARQAGTRLVLGLRDILDDAPVVAEELRGAGWDGVTDLFDEAFVYGARHFCDHEVEYGLPLPPRYCGWVTQTATAMPDQRDRRLLAVTAGGGGDGDSVFRLGVALAERRPGWRAVIAAGPYAAAGGLQAVAAASPAADRLTVATFVAGCRSLFARATAVVQMAGYNSTFEALAAGHRPILVPRIAPRREQAIRAERLEALGLADVVPEDTDPAHVDVLLDQPRLVAPEHLQRAGIDLDGATRVAVALRHLSAKALR